MKRQLLLSVGLLLSATPGFAQSPYGSGPEKPAPATAATVPARSPAVAPPAVSPPATQPPGAQTPTGQAPMGRTPTGQAPAGQAPAQPQSPMAPGLVPGMPHPPLGGGHPGMPRNATEPARDASDPSPTLPPGTVEVTLADENDAPLGGRLVELIVSFESVAEGPQEERRRLTTDESGRARFTGLSRELNYTYAVASEREGGHYGVPAFRLKQDQGQAVLLHVFPTTHDPNQAYLGLRGFVFIQPREDLFQVEMLFRVINLGTVSWVPKDVVLNLPEGFSAIESPSDEGDTRFVEAAGRGARMEGTFPPGQRDVRFSFHMPSHSRSTQSLELTLPPHVAELRVITEASPGMTLDVDGFDRAEPARGPTGDRVLITRRMMRAGDGQLTDVHIRIGGLPVQGPARWGVVAAAAVIALSGLAWAFRHRGKSKGRHAVAGEDLDRARALLLDELVAVERALESGAIGPRTHEQTRRQLLDALARLELVPRLAEPAA